MAAPAAPTSAWPGKGFYQLMIEGLTICSNLNLPQGDAASNVTVFGGTTAALLIASLTVQRNLL